MITLTVVLKNCKKCNHIDHSGAFTPGGAKPVCDHPDACKCVAQYNPKLIGLDESNPTEYYHWKHRVIPYKRVEDDYNSRGYHREVKGTIPVWCPLKNGSTY